MQRLFVYGTLVPGKENHYLLEHLEGSWEPAFACGTLKTITINSTGRRFLSFVPGSSDQYVAGFLFSSVELGAQWAMLDEFEGTSYQRCTIEVTTENDEVYLAHVYADSQSFELFH